VAAAQRPAYDGLWSPRLREWSWWDHTGGGEALAFQTDPRCGEREVSTYIDDTVANRYVRGFGWEVAHEAVSRRPPIPLPMIVARSRIYTYDANVRDLCLVTGAIFCRPVPNLTFRFAIFSPLYDAAKAGWGFTVVRC
jgi:hypothetical protein